MIALASCGKRRDDDDRPARAVAPAGPALRAIAELRGLATLVAGTRRIAVAVEDGWYEPVSGTLVARPELGAAIARARTELGGELVEVHLGRAPVVAGGEEHREQVLRFAPAATPVSVEGMVLQIAATASGELWRIEHELRSELASVDATGALTMLPAFALVRPAPPGDSPVSARACAAPKVRELAGGGDAIAALVTECAPDAPVRVARYRWPGPSVTITSLAPLGQLGFQIDHLVAGRTGAPVLVGRRGETLVIARLAPDGTLAATDGPTGIEAVPDAAVADDGAVWTLTVARTASGRDLRRISRDGAPVALTGPSGAEIRPENLAVDDQLGIVVLGWENAAHWLLAERAAGSPSALGH